MHNGKLKILGYRDIVYMTHSDNYTQIIISKSTTIYYSMYPLIWFKNQLPAIFFHCHRSIIVNIGYIDTIDKTRRNIITLSGQKLPVSRNNIKSLISKMQDLEHISIPLCEQCNHCCHVQSCQIIHPYVKYDFTI
ncbi:MAG: LytTR family transcriptional regulator DNA-binding domain-containing protein [Tannerella sp.]|nr:LytTR family transcriptional regulator DNA-binding domain-containing protein [Tannerella sp.]